MRTSVSAAIMLAGLFGALPTSGHAATMNVAPGAVIVAADGLCSLREAIHNANADSQVDNSNCPAGSSGNDSIVLATGALYELPDPDPANSQNGLPVVTTDIHLAGNGATIQRDPDLACTLDGTRTATEFRILQVTSAGNLTLADLTLSHGCADGSGPSNDGGALRVDGSSLNLERVRVIDNHARDKSGGLDATNALVGIFESSFVSNSANGGGGAIGIGAGTTASLGESAVTGNSSGGDGGGGIGNFGTLDVEDSTISANATNGTGGGGIGNQGTLTVSFSTVTNNSVAGGGLGGGGIANAGSLQIKSSIVAGNSTGGDCINLGTFAATGVNFDIDGSCQAIDADFAQVTPAALALGPLADHGGPTETHSLLAGSVAIDAALDCTTVFGGPDPLDQRGVARPQDGDDNGTAACDVGAYELENFDVLVVDGTCSLGDAIEAANTDQITVGGCVDASAGPDTIVLDVDTILSAPDLVRSDEQLGAYAGLPNVTSEITIQAGAASTIARNAGLACDDPASANAFRLLQVIDDDLTLDGVTLENGCADQGGAVLVAEGSLTVVDSVFRGNTALAEAGAAGGAIFGDPASSISITGSTFEDNRAESGTSSDTRGGALCAQGILTTLRGTVFQRNRAAGPGDVYGGALWVDTTGPLDWTDLVFEDSQALSQEASAYGGAVGLGGLGSPSRLERASFVGNQAVGGLGSNIGVGFEGLGGALHAAWDSPLETLRDVTFLDNLAQGGPGTTGPGGAGLGGAVLFDGDDGVERRNLTFSGNRAIGGDSVSGVGGKAQGGAVVFWYSPGLEHSTVTDNRAIAGTGGAGAGVAQGGGLWVEDPDIELDSNLLEGNVVEVGGVVTPQDCGYILGTPPTSLGYNVVSAPGGCTFTATGDQVGEPPSLLPIGDHGCTLPLPDGTCLPTHPVALGSAAYEAGSCVASGVTADTRGLVRPWDDPNVVNADDGCDAGAYESRDEDGDGVEDGVDACPGDPTNHCPLFSDGFETGTLSAWSAAVP